MSSLKSGLLDTAGSQVQNHAPVDQLDLHLISLPCYTHNLHKQRLTHHYCHRIEPGIWQCVMYDGPEKNSRLIGVEWVIDEQHYKTVPQSEQRMWHTHHQEVRGGNTLAPGLPAQAEIAVMQELANTYGYAVHFLAEGDRFPSGPPKLIVTLCTPETQSKLLDKSVWKEKDEVSSSASQAKAIERHSLEYHDRLPGADQWERGGKLWEFVCVPVDRSAEIVEKYGAIRNEKNRGEANV